MPQSPVEELALLDLDRSNKGASKQRRDLINAEIATMRDLLPLPETARQRLSQLQIMSLSCVYIRKCNVLQKLFRSFSSEANVPTMCDFFQALTGFLLITTREGKLVYISENVTDYLGHSMVDMKTQGDSLYDIVDRRDHGTVQAQLLQGGAELDVTRDVAFFSRMNMSRTLKRQAGFGDVKVMHVRGHFIPLSDPDSDDNDQPQQGQPGQSGSQIQGQQPGSQKYVLMATCSPLITPELKENLVHSNTMVFKTVHQLDMTFLEVTKTAEYHLGFTTEEICQKSWYSMLHPEDIHEAREKHIMLIRSSHEMGCMMTVRMLNVEGAVLWVNIVMHVRQAASTHNDEPLIVCINQVISEEEAYQIRVQSHMFTMYPPRAGDLWTAGLAASTHSSSAHPPPSAQTETNVRWMPSAAPATPSATYPSPYYQQPPQLPCTLTYAGLPDPSGYRPLPSSSSPPSSSSAPHGQTDKLKLMLKRKIQGPCRPAKIPKLAWADQAEGSMGECQGMEYAATGDPMHSPDSAAASQFVGIGGGGGYANWHVPSQVVMTAQYRAAHVMPMALARKTKSGVLPAPVIHSSLSPPLSVAHTHSVPEQVVPDSGVAVPESYLTPDPSPASSPLPHTSAATATVKVEVADKAAPTSAAILQELEKLAALQSSKNNTPAASNMPAIKTEKIVAPEGNRQRRRKELPIMDAFDIESFFDKLSGDPLSSTEKGLCPPANEDAKMKAMVVKVSMEKTAMPVIKQEPMDEDAGFGLAAVQQQQQEPILQDQRPTAVQQQKPVAENRGVDQGKMDSRGELDLLDFFSGEMTATLLDFGPSLTTQAKDDGDLLIESVKAFADSCGGQEDLSCGAGHLDSFLLHSAGLQRPVEGYSPVPSSEVSSDVNSDLSGDEEELLQVGGRKVEGGGERLLPSSLPSPPQCPALGFAPSPQDVPGISEEDELYQLDKLLSSVVSNTGLMLSADPQ